MAAEVKFTSLVPGSDEGTKLDLDKDPDLDIKSKNTYYNKTK